jgi:hypothetical protein
MVHVVNSYVGIRYNDHEVAIRKICTVVISMQSRRLARQWCGGVPLLKIHPAALHGRMEPECWSVYLLSRVPRRIELLSRAHLASPIPNRATPTARSSTLGVVAVLLRGA